MITFEYPYALLLAPAPFLIYHYMPGYFIKERAIKVPFFALLTTLLNIQVSHGSKELKPTPVQRLSIWLGWGLLLIAAAKPVWLMEPQTFERSGRDLMLVLDLSGSMGVEDYVDDSLKPSSRLATAKKVLNDFSQQRTSDRLGLILFGDAPFVQSPFTTDYIAWSELLNQSQVGMAGESTHLGDAIGLGIKTLVGQKNGDVERVMIVLTDGNDTDSLVPPIDAAKVAAAYGVCIHMIAMGSTSTLGEEAIDTAVIEEVAKITGGHYFYAASTEELSSIYKVIDEMEETLYESYTYQQSHSLHYLPVLLMVTFHLIFMAVKTMQVALRNRATNP